MTPDEPGPPPPADPSASGPIGGGRPRTDSRERTIDRQTAALERLAVVLDPTKKPKKRGVARFVGYMMLASSAVLGGYEFVSWLLEQWERRAMLSNWIEAAREMQDVENSPDMALELLAKADEVDPQNADVVRLRAYVRGMQTVKRLLNLDRPFSTEDVAAANLAAAEAALLEKLDPEAADWALLRGQLAMAQKEPERARAYFEQALALDPENVLARVRLSDMHQDAGSLLRSEGREEEAEQELLEARRLLDEAIERDPTSKLAWLYRGIHQREQDPDEAIKAFERAIALDGRFELAIYQLAVVYFLQERLDDAEDALVRALEVKPDDVMSLTLLAQLYGRKDEYESALLYARKATEVNRGSIYAWSVRAEIELDMGTVAIEAGREEEGKALRTAASESYGRAIDLDPRSADIRKDRSKLLLRMGRLEAAGVDARQATELAPHDPFAWSALAEYQIAIGETEAARRSLERILELEPRFDTAHEMMAGLLEESGDLAGAETSLTSAIEVAEGDFRSRFLRRRSEVRERRGDLGGALEDAVAARELEPEQFELWVREARLLLALERLEEACATLVEANQRRPSEPEVVELRAKADCG